MRMSAEAKGVAGSPVAAAKAVEAAVEVAAMEEGDSAEVDSETKEVGWATATMTAA